MPTEADRDLARRHIVDGEARIARQVELLADLRANGSSIEEGERLLLAMEQSLALMRLHLTYIEAKLAGR